MKVAIVVHQFLPRYTTGTERYAHTLACGFRDRGLAVTVFTGEDDDRSLLAEDDDAVDGLPVHRLVRHRSLEADPIRGEYDSALTEAAFARFLAAERPDVVHFFHLYNLGGGLLDAAWAHGVPYFVHLMDYWFLCPRIQMLDYEGQLCAGPREAARCARCASEVDGNYRPLLEAGGEERADPEAEAARTKGLRSLEARWPWLRERLLRASGVIAPSRYLRDRFVENGLAREHVHHLAYGVALEAVESTGRETPPAGEVRFGYLGNLATFKGAHLALEAFTRLEGTQLSLRVYGDFFFREPEQMAACRKHVEGDDRITMCGRYEHPQLASILAELDAVVVPSLWHENTPFVVLEALRSGTPVIASEVGGISEAVRHGKDGLLFARGDVRDLARQMQRFVDGEGPSAVQADHIPGPAANVDDLLLLYRQAVAAYRPPSADEVRKVQSSLCGRLYGAMEAIGKRLGALGAATGRDRDVVEALRESGRVREELSGHRAALAERTEELERLQADFARVETDYRRQLEERDRRAEEMNADLEAHRQGVRELEDDLECHRAKVGDLEEDLARRRAHAAQQQSELENRGREMERLAAANEAGAAVAAGLREDLVRHRDSITELSREREALQKVVSDLEQDLAGHRRALELAHENASRLSAARDAAEAQRVQVTIDLQVARDAAGDQAAAIRRLEARLAALSAEIDTTAQGRNL